MKKLSILLAGLAFTVGFGQEFTSVRNVVGDAQPNVQFAPEGTNDACSVETLSNDFENGFGPVTGFQWANDFTIEDGVTFAINQFKYNMIVDPGATVDASDVYFYADTAGAGPGEEVGYVDFVVPTSVEVVGTLGDFEVVEVVLDFDSVELDGGATYWVGLQIYSDSSVSYWEVTSNVTTEEEIWVYDGTVWVPVTTAIPTVTDIYDGVFTLSGDCTTMSTSEVSEYQLSVYPNPANDVLNVSLKNAEIQSVSISNLSGQVVSTTKATNSVNISTLPAGVYVVKVLDNKGKTHVSKVIVK